MAIKTHFRKVERGPEETRNQNNNADAGNPVSMPVLHGLELRRNRKMRNPDLPLVGFPHGKKSEAGDREKLDRSELKIFLGMVLVNGRGLSYYSVYRKS